MTTIDNEPVAVRPTQSRSAATASWLAARASRLGAAAPVPARGPFARWPRLSDAVLVVIVFVASMVAVTASELEEGEPFSARAIGELPISAMILMALAAGALWWRRSRPLEVTAFVLVMAIVWAVAQDGDGNDLPMMVALYSVGRYAADDTLGVAALTAAVTTSVVASVVDASQRIDVLPALLLPALPWYVGRRVRNRGDYLSLLRERAERLEAEHDARARRAVADERARIARELHDVVAHQVSMMTVQAGAAKMVARDDPDAAIESLGDVERAGRQALGELRHLLGVLRLEAGGDDDLGPQRGLADVPALVDQLRHAGAHVELTVAEVVGASAALDLSAYRIVQESLTNVVKHGGPSPSASVDIAFDGGTVVIDIVNAVDAASSGNRLATEALPRSGFGIAGMRERAALLGGTLTAAPFPPDRFRVHARLPLDRQEP